MKITNCTKQDFDRILAEFNEFWGHDRTLALHHPTLINEFGNSAFILKDSQKIIAYLFGFISQTSPVGYIQLLAVRQGHRHEGHARRLYEHFTSFALAHGCKQLKAITSPVNKLSIAFHQSIGMMPVGEDIIAGVAVIRDYAGHGKDRVVFMKDIEQNEK
ncbi:MAG: GNAT family N-acetyltransferase [Dehalococcoidia bacterium]|nr:GNAT family N-acetyltransferase [Dehalococcoidia bacterium]